MIIFDHYRCVCITSGLLVFFLSTITWASNYQVNNGDVNCSDTHGTPFCTIRAAVEHSVDGDSIAISVGQYPGNIVIDKDLEIQGSGDTQTIIDAENASFGVKIKEFAKVSLTGLTIQHGHSAQGAGISNYGHLTLRDCAIKNNVASQSGGGIYNGGLANATLLITHCNILGNKALGDDRYNIKYGGGGIFNNGKLHISHSQIAHNRAAENGGGIYTIYRGEKKVSEAQLILTELGFYAGSTRHKQLGSSANIDDVSIKNSNVSYNRADNGGGIAVHSVLRMVSSTIDHNKAMGSRISSGGGIFAHFDAQLVLLNMTMSGNYATARGGALRYYSKVGGEMVNVTVAFNQVDRHGEGAGVFVVNHAEALTINHVLMVNNMVNSQWGADCDGALNSIGFNMIEVADGCRLPELQSDFLGTLEKPLDVAIAPLADNGGDTLTHQLPNGSIAVDAGSMDGCAIFKGFVLAQDQRGEKRIQDGNGDGIAACDMGAVEK